MSQDFRAEVARFRAGESRRVFPLGVHVGSPDGERRSLEVPWPVPADHDAGLRFDLVVGLLEDATARCHPTWAWLTRPGIPEVHDVDLAWLSAATRAFGALGVPMTGFRVVTRAGWLDVVTGESRTWQRLRA